MGRKEGMWGIRGGMVRCRVVLMGVLMGVWMMGGRWGVLYRELGMRMGVGVGVWGVNGLRV